MENQQRRPPVYRPFGIEDRAVVAVGDRGTVARFGRPGVPRPHAWIADLREGPGPWGRKLARDAESLAADPRGRGFWVGFEQSHSLFLYDGGFSGALESIDLGREDIGAFRLRLVAVNNVDPSREDVPLKVTDDAGRERYAEHVVLDLDYVGLTPKRAVMS